MPKVIWTERALGHVKKIGEYLQEQSPQAAVSVTEGIIHAVQSLMKNPRMGWRDYPDSDREIRCILYGHYRIIYEIIAEEELFILAVVHTSQDVSRFK